MQDPGTPEGRVELDWDELDYFELDTQGMTLPELMQELCTLMPEYINWLKHGQKGNGPADLEIWDRFAYQ